MKTIIKKQNQKKALKLLSLGLTILASASCGSVQAMMALQSLRSGLVRQPVATQPTMRPSQNPYVRPTLSPAINPTQSRRSYSNQSEKTFSSSSSSQPTTNSWLGYALSAGAVAALTYDLFTGDDIDRAKRYVRIESADTCDKTHSNHQLYSQFKLFSLNEETQRALINKYPDLGKHIVTAFLDTGEMTRLHPDSEKALSFALSTPQGIDVLSNYITQNNDVILDDDFLHSLQVALEINSSDPIIHEGISEILLALDLAKLASEKLGCLMYRLAMAENNKQSESIALSLSKNVKLLQAMHRYTLYNCVNDLFKQSANQELKQLLQNTIRNDETLCNRYSEQHFVIVIMSEQHKEKSEWGMNF